MDNSRFKFRVWNKARKCWDSAWALNSNGEPWFITNNYDTGCATINKCNFLDDIELTQSTGLYDCEGKQIWEGDVCEYRYIDRYQIEFNGVAIVYWDEVDRGFALRVIEDSHNDLLSEMPLFHAGTSLKLKAIGNRFENSELLEDVTHWMPIPEIDE